MKSEFENSIKRSSSYEKLVYQHGERLFIFDDGKYKIAAVQLAWEIFKEKQTEVDELQRRNQMLNDNIKEQGQKLVYQNEVIETQAEKLIDLRDEKAELQKRVDAVKQLIQEYRDPATEDKTFQHALSIVAYELEQALKGGGE
jgi:hypothetical protein